jgi:trehalose/maltose hydrolase-like predicted phosphorylase
VDGPDRDDGPRATGGDDGGTEVLRRATGCTPGGWSVTVPPGRPGLERVEESCLAVADGRTGVRGSLEEDGAGSRPGVYAAGIYEREPDGSERLVEAPTWTAVDLAASPGPGVRLLDLRTGAVSRTVERDGRTVLQSVHWLCLARPGTGVLVAEVDGDLMAAPGGVGADGDQVDTTAVPSALGGVIEMTSVTRVAPLPVPAGVAGPDDPPPAVVTRLVGVVAGRRTRTLREDPTRLLGRARRSGIAGLWDEQVAAWARRWEVADVEVVGDEELTRAVRFGLFHLMASVASRGEAAVGARGMTGPAYDGHVFWDADVFVLPFLAATWPRSARAMLEYRLRRLPAARAAAAAAGFAGARFPWESADDGTDVTPTSGVDEAGHVVRILTGQEEEHITADVGWAAWQLAAWAGSWRFLDGPGRPLLVEPARYFEHRMDVDRAGSAHLRAVIGPDEYHEHVDDNAYTNLMVSWLLRRAAEVGDRQPGTVVPGEPARWRTLAHRLVDGYDEERGIHEQFAGYGALEPLMVAELGTPPLAADLVLGRERLAGSQIVKQADVLMAHLLVPDGIARGSLAADLDFYLPRTAHGSSLSPAVHAALLARMGRTDAARQLLHLAARVDLDDLTGTTAGGLHLATFGGVWQALVNGFAGVRVTGPDDRALVVDPQLPPEWEELRLRVQWHGRRVALRCRNDRVHVTTDRLLAVQLGAGPVTAVHPPGAWVERTGGRGDGGRREEAT